MNKKDIEKYVHKQITQGLNSYIGQPISERNQEAFLKTIKLVAENELKKYISANNVFNSFNLDVSFDSSKQFINIEIKPIQPLHYYHSLFTEYHVSEENVKTHNFKNVGDVESYKCFDCGFLAYQDNAGFLYNYDGDYSCDEYIIKKII